MTLASFGANRSFPWLRYISQLKSCLVPDIVLLTFITIIARCHGERPVCFIQAFRVSSHPAVVAAHVREASTLVFITIYGEFLYIWKYKRHGGGIPKLTGLACKTDISVLCFTDFLFFYSTLESCSKEFKKHFETELDNLDLHLMTQKFNIYVNKWMTI